MPYTTESWFWGWEYFTAGEWARYFQLLKRYGAKVNLMIVCYNVSKRTGAWVPYTATHGDVIEVFREGIAEGVAMAEAHGATHVTPYEEYFVESNATDPWQLTLAIRYEFGYDPHRGRPIPYELQEEHLRNMTATIEAWFGYKPLVWTPPWHVYNRDSVRIIEALGYRFLSASTRLVGDDVPACLMGEKVPGSNVTCVPMNNVWDGLPTDAEGLSRYVEPYVRAGIPMVFISHGRNWTIRGHTTTFTLSENEARLRLLNELYGVKYVFLRELGEELDKWRGVSCRALLYEDKVEALIVVEAGEVSMRIEAWKPRSSVRELIVDGERVAANATLRLGRGEHRVLAYFERREELEASPLEEMWPAIILASSALASAIAYIVARWAVRKRLTAAEERR